MARLVGVCVGLSALLTAQPPRPQDDLFAHTNHEWLRYTNETSPHAPPQVRANGSVSHVDALHEAFGVAPGDRFYRPADGRRRVW